MKNIFPKLKINFYTYIFLLICLFCGYIKNIIIIYFICLFHELGHIFFIKLFNYEIISIELFPFGGYTEINKKINSRITYDLFISLGGILFQLILLLILLIIKNNFNIITYNLIFKYNLYLIFFNLIPIIPLDGNKILHLILEILFPYKLAYYLNLYFSIIFIIIFIFINYYQNFKYIYKRFLLERYLSVIYYNKINNHTKNLKDLRKNVLHFFKKDNKYIKENHIVKDYLCKLIDKGSDF